MFICYFLHNFWTDIKTVKIGVCSHCHSKFKTKSDNLGKTRDSMIKIQNLLYLNFIIILEFQAIVLVNRGFR